MNSAKELNSARDRLYQNAIDYFLAKEGIEALYIQGSVAEDSVNEFSDIDFRVVVEPKVYQQYILERFDAPKDWGKWIFNEWTDRPWICVSHFQPFNKIDVFYFLPEELQPSPWFSLPTKVIYDPKGLIKNIIRASQKSEFDLLTVEEVERLISKGLAYSSEVYRRTVRKELFYAQSQLDSLRKILIQFDDYLHHSIPSSGFGSPSHFERRGSKSAIEVLNRSYAVLEPRSILQALHILLSHYQTQVIKLHQLLPLKRAQDTDLQWIEMISDLCNFGR